MTPRAPRRRRPRRLPRALVAGAAALLLHGTGFGVLYALAAAGLILGPRPATPARSLQAVGVRSIPAGEWDRNRGAKPADSKSAVARKERPPEEKRAEQIPGPVVDVPPGNGETDPDARYAAETSNRAEKQTKSSEMTPLHRNAMPRRTAPRSGNANGNRVAQGGGNAGQADDDRPLADGKQKRVLELPDVARRDEVRVGQDPAGTGPLVANRTESAEVRGNSKRLRLVPGEAGEGEEASQGRAGKTGIASLAPSADVLDSVVGAPALEYLPDVEKGDGTYLSTREWKYAGYMNRFKRSVQFEWRPMQELARRDPTLGLYGGVDRTTLLQVTLDAEGRLKDLYVARSSGLDFLDLVAMSAVERAQPFPNPPRGMLGEDGTIRFAFGFHVLLSEISGGGRMYRSWGASPR